MWFFVVFVLALNSVSQADNINICEKSSGEIVCPKRQVIHIQNANYGRTDADICGGEKTNFDEGFDECILHTSLATVQRTCEKKRSCVLQADNSEFYTDPCEQFPKYLNVTYSCISTLSKEVCVPYLPLSLYLTCDDNEKLNILSVFYGREDNFTCRTIPLFDLGTCESSEGPTHEIMNHCHGRNYCSFFSPIGLLNGCMMKDPYLRVVYQCIPE